MKKLILKDDLRFLIFGEVYSKYSEPKTRRKAFAILESAVTCFAKKGFDQATLAMIAREAGVNRQLLDHYFEDLSEIRDFALKYVRLVGQNIVVGQIKDEKRPDVVLKNYIEAHAVWLTSFKVHIRVWLSFLSACAGHSRDREMNSIAVAAGTNRLEELLTLGKQANLFACENPRVAAKLIQTMMLGWLVSMLTEDEENVRTLTSDVVSECLKIAGARPT